MVRKKSPLETCFNYKEMEQNFYKKLRDSINTERDFQPDDADWAALQTQLEQLPVASVPFYFTTKFLLAMMTTFLMALTAFFWLGNTENTAVEKDLIDTTSIVELRKPNINKDTELTSKMSQKTVFSAIIPSHEQVVNTPTLSNNSIAIAPIVESTKAIHSQTTTTSVPSTAADFTTNNTNNSPSFSYQGAQNTRYENSTTTAKNSLKDNSSAYTENTDNQLIIEQIEVFNFLNKMENIPLQMQTIEEDTFIIRQKPVKVRKASPFRFQMSIFAIGERGFFDVIFMPEQQVTNYFPDPYASLLIGAGLKLSTVYNNKIRATFHVNSNESQFYTQVQRLDQPISATQFNDPNFHPSGEFISNESFLSNDFEYGFNLDFFPLQWRKFRPFFGFGFYNIKRMESRYSFSYDENELVDVVTYRTKTVGRETISAALGAEYNLKNDFSLFVETVGFFRAKNQLTFVSHRYDIGVNYTF